MVHTQLHTAPAGGTPPSENHTHFDLHLLPQHPARKGPWNKSPAQYNPKGHYVLELFIT